MTLVPFAAVIVLAGCPLPIPTTEATSAPVVGRIVREDGIPAPNIDVVISTGWSDNACGKVAVRTRTTPSGAFELPGTEETHSVTWFVPNLDRGPMSYRLCAGVRDTLRRAYRGYGALYPPAETDSVSCIIWEWEATSRVSCAGRARRDVVEGGRWTDSTTGASGFYRLLLTEEPTQVKGYDKDAPQDRPYVYVQWVEPRPPSVPDTSAPYRVHATIGLPFDRNKGWDVRELQLWQRGGQWVGSNQFPAPGRRLARPTAR